MAFFSSFVSVASSDDRSHPGLTEERVIPLLLHGDEGAGPKKLPVLVVSVSCPLSRAESLNKKFPLIILPSKYLCKETWLELQTVLSEGLNAAWHKRTRGYKSCFVGVKGDWKFHVQLFPSEGVSYTSDQICLCCGASKTDPSLLSTDLSDSAGWLSSVLEEPRNPANLPPLSKAAGWSFFCYFMDLLHTIWLGIGRDAVGSFIVDILECSSSSETLATIFIDLGAYCDSNGIQHHLAGLTWSDIGVSSDFSYPHFKKSGYSCKVFLNYLAVKLQLVPGLEKQASCCWFLVEYQRVLDQAGSWLTEEEASSAVAAGQSFLDLWSDLAATNLEQGRCNYKIRPKHHNFSHFGVDRIRRGSRMNPRLTSCWLDEDFVGQICRASRTCHSASLPLRMFHRHTLELNRRFAQMERSRS